MNKLTIPSSPNWYENDIMACAPDNTLLYGSRQDLVVVKPTSDDEPDEIRVISKAHSMKIVSVNLNRNWDELKKYAVTVSEDKIVKAWDIGKMEKISSHDKHSTDQSKIVTASFAGDLRIVSVSETGSVIVWSPFSNETTPLNSLFATKVTVTCMSICPHANWMAAFGLKSGLVVVTDLRRSGRVLYSLRGHSKSVVSLVWCPAPVNIFPVTPLNKVVEKVADQLTVDTEEHQSLSSDIKTVDKEEHQSLSSDVKSSEVNQLLTVDKEELLTVDTEEHQSLSSEIKTVDREENQSLSSDVKSSEVNQLLTVDKEELLTVDNEENQSLSSDVKSSEVNQLLTVDKEELLTVEKEDNHSQSSNVKSLEVDQFEDEKLPTSDDKTSAETPVEEDLLFEKFEKKTRRKQDSPTKQLNFGTDFAHSVKKKSKKPRKSSGGISDFLAKTKKSSSSEESRQFCSASSCDNDLNCSKKKNLENEVFYDAQEEEKSWRTEQLVRKNEQPRKEFLLASSAREPKIYIWRAGTDGRMQTFLKIPAPKYQNRKKTSKESLPWIVLCWPQPTTLLSSSHNAELIAWNLPKPGQSLKFCRIVHKEHWSVVFSIKAPILYSDEYNFLRKIEQNVWSTGMERKIVSSDLESGEIFGCYPAFGGSVNCLEGSPLDPNRLAIGTGEGLVNTWDLSRPHLKSINFSTFYNQILSSVTALAWHPVNENLLAFGTTEGRVGVIDVNQKSKSPKILKHHFKSQIFKLEWGPPDEKTGKNFLFAVSESKVAVFCTESKGQEPKLLELPDNTSVFTMAWKPDYSMLIVSAKSGMLITYNPKLEIQNISYLSNKLLAIKWHPDSVSNDSKYRKTFASLIKYSEIVVMDSESNEKIVAKFENRGVRIGDFAWSPHSGNLLVLVDDGGVAQVFDVEAQNVVSTYVSPALDQLLAVYWSPLDPDFIITGTVSHKIVIWMISENLALNEKEINSCRNKITKALQKEVGDLLTKEKQSKKIEAKEEPKAKISSKSELVPLFFIPKENNWIENLQLLLQTKLGKKIEALSDDENLNILDIFGDGGNMEKLFQLNLNNFKKQGQFKRANLLTLVQGGDLKKAIEEAIDHKRVDPWIISVCPMVSPKLWQTACEIYVDQLLEEPEADPMEIVTFMLACHRVEEAVDFLKDRLLFKEAFLLAKCRFGAGDSLTAQVVDEWAKKATYQGNFELAAGCYISLEKYGEAAAVLFRRTDCEVLTLAARLARLADNEELHKAINSRLEAFKPMEVAIEKKQERDELLLEEILEFDKDVAVVQEKVEKVVNEDKKIVEKVTETDGELSNNGKIEGLNGNNEVIEAQTEISGIVLTKTDIIEPNLEEKE